MSESQAKIPNPGRKQAWRLYDKRGTATADVLGRADETIHTGRPITLHHPVIPTSMRRLPEGAVSNVETLLTAVLEGGKRLEESPTIDELRRRRIADLERLDPGVRRLINPHVYHVSLTDSLWDMKVGMVRRLMGE